jgi:hypothetical protein
MLAALREVAAIQNRMRLTPGGDSDEFLREARDGGVYGIGRTFTP